MSSEVFRTILDLLLPPMGPLILITLGLLVWLFRMPKFAAFCILLGAVLLYLASIPYFARQLLDPLQYEHEVLKEIPSDIQAIVVLSGGRLPIAREYDSLDTVNATTLQRLRYAAKLAKATELPILAVGGTVNDERRSEATLMKHIFEIYFGVQVTWMEHKSKNTFENAKFSKSILDDNSISSFLLVTHAYHMPRAVWCFEKVGLEPTPAPTVFYKRNTHTPNYQDYLPKVSALRHTKIALHEYFGKLWYKYFVI